MLKTLLKHEWKDTWIWGTACNIVAILLAFVGALIIYLQDFSGYRYHSDTQTALLAIGLIIYMVLYILSIAAIVLFMRYFFFYRYYKNLFTDQGYLMHTLPVKKTDLIHSKLIVAVIWQYITSLVVVFCITVLIFAFVGAFGELDFWDLAEDLSQIDFSEMKELLQIVPIMIASVLLYILGPIMEVLLMYVAVGIGQLTNKNRFIVSALVLVGIYFAKRILVSMVSFPAQIILQLNSSNAQIYMYLLSFGMVAVYLGAIVGLYFANKYFVEKKLNLE